MPWETNVSDSRPWRADPRLAGLSPDGYPDDVPVAFIHPDSARGGTSEVMWVRIIAHDPPTDLFLGILLNVPSYLTDPPSGDNVVFRVQPTLNVKLRAVADPEYSNAGWPASAAPAHFALLKEGIRAYRAGHNGHVPEMIARCIDVLLPAAARIPPEASPDERFATHFVAGRCLAEAYNTEEAIRQFRAAIAVDSGDVHSQMALLAELSVMVHRRPGTVTPAEDARWEEEFVRQLAIVKARFGHDSGVQEILGLVFDPRLEGELDPLWQPHAARLRRIGYAIFRWKSR
jgi:hypothetical protein